MSRAYGYTAYGGPETQTWFEREEPKPGPSELTIKVRAVGVNPVDYKVRGGLFADPAAAPDFPVALGTDAAGVVTAVGADVSGFAVGDEVFGKAAPGHGTYAEHAVLAAASTTAKPAGVDFVQAAALPVAGGTAWDVLAALAVKTGETLLINGAGGGVGVMAAQLARDRGVTVLGVAGQTKRDLLESLGATLVSYSDGDVADQVRALLPDGVDAVFDLVGGDEMRAVATLCDDPNRVVSIADPDVSELGGRFLMGGTDGLATLARLVGQGKVDPKVLQTYPFDEAPQALRAIEVGHSMGKIVIDLQQSTHT